MTDTPVPPSKALKWLSRTSIFVWGGCVLVALLLALAWGILTLLIVPRIEEFRPALEQRLSQTIGAPLRIGRIRAEIQGMQPHFELLDVRLTDTEGQDAMVLKQVSAVVSPQSLLRLGVEQVVIEQPALAVRRDVRGRITVAGLSMPENTSSTPDYAAADWLFAQRELVVRGGSLQWTDELRRAPPLSLSQVDIYIRNSGTRHLMRIDATPPTAWGKRFALQGDFNSPVFTEHVGNWQLWEGQAFADLPHVDVQQLQTYTSLGFDVRGGRGALRGWLSYSAGLVNDVTLDVALTDVGVRLKPELPQLAMRQVSGRASLQMTALTSAFQTENLAFELEGGKRWPGGNVQFRQGQASSSAPVRGEFKATRLDLAALTDISDRLPLDKQAHQWLDSLAPRGMVSQVQAQWTGRYSAPEHYSAQGSVQQLELNAHTPTVAAGAANGQFNTWHPGVQGAQVDFKLSETGGQAKLSIAAGRVHLPLVFEEPVVPVQELRTDMAWRIVTAKSTPGQTATEPRLEVDLNDVLFSNADTQAQGTLRWHTSDPRSSHSRSRFPGVLDLSLAVPRFDVGKTARYLPLKIQQEAREYVRAALPQGNASKGSIKVKGDIYDFPFDAMVSVDGKATKPAVGEFRLSTQVSNATLDYVPKSFIATGSVSWPPLTGINADLVMDKRSLSIKGASFKIAGAPSVQGSKADAFIPELSQNMSVQLQAEGKGAASDWLSIVNRSPLAEITNQTLSKATANGQADMRVRLNLPVFDLARSKVQGTATLNGNDVQVSPDSPALQQAKGVLSFNERGFALSDVSARMLGGEVRLEGGSRPQPLTANDVTVALRVQGHISAEAMRQAKELAWLSRIAASASGSTSYTAVVNIRRGFPELQVSSNLQGLALSLPAPLQKSADATLPLRYENSLLKESLADGKSLQDQVSLDLPGLASVNYWRDISGAQPRVLRGRIGVGLTPGEVVAANDTPGVAAAINFAQVDFDAWARAIGSVGNVGNAGGAGTSGPSNASVGGDTTAYLPSIMSVRAKDLTVQGRTLHNVVIGGSRDDLTWRANLDAREINGYVEYRQASPGNAGRVYARLARLSLAEQVAQDIEAALDSQPSSIPALDIVVEDFELRGKNLGRVEVDARNLESGGVREWRLAKLNVTMPEAQLSATGNWTALGAQRSSSREVRRRTALSFKLDIANTGDLLKRFGQDKVIARGKGKLEGNIAWLGAPWAMHYPSMSGGFNVDVEAGQFLKADPGIGKLLGVLSLQSLPRRLALDFRDVFSEGFAFDFIRGDMKIEQGQASTNNLQMKGVNAAVLMEGTANIERETQNLRVVVVPEINAGTASLLATVINPVVGLGTFLAQMILRRPVIEAATQEFRIDGSWADPQVQRIKRATPDAAANTTPSTPQ